MEVIAATVKSGGGYVHPELVVNHDGGNLWLSLPRSVNPFADEPLDKPHPEAPPALIVPNALHVPVTNLDWAPSDEVLEYRADPGHLSPEQRTILDAMVALFNSVDKVRIVGRAYAQHSLDDDPELLALVREARPGYKAGAAQEAPADGDRGDADQAETAADQMAGAGNWWHGEESPAHTVVTSRLRSEMGEGDEGPIGLFMPMIDMLNHHPYGSRYERTEAGDWLIRAHHPKPDSDQIYVRYNKADAMGVALGLGYFEADARFVSSVACEFKVAGLGTVDVLGVSQQRRRLPAPRVMPAEDGLRVAGVVLEPGREQVLRTLLGMPLRSILATGQNAEPRTAESRTPEELAADMVAGIVAANIDYYQRLAEFCASADSAAHPLRPMFAEVAARQLELLAQYQL